MKVVLLSDTHMRHASLLLPPADLLVHAGDFTNRGTKAQSEKFLQWFAAQPAQEKILIAGNHDYFAEQEPLLMQSLSEQLGIHYLQDAAIQILGLHVWGSPITPQFRNMAFNRPRGEAIRQHWDKIPKDLDLLLTHGPPHGVGDRTVFGMRVGCEELRQVVLEKKPKMHVFGHIHEARGAYTLPECPTQFINAANCSLLHFSREPLVVEL